MKLFKDYKIEIFGLKNGSHEFDFVFEDKLFSQFENSQVTKGKGTCKVKMTKSDSMITLLFEVAGTIELECDRSLEKFDYQVQINKDQIYKYGEEEKELSEDVFVILKGTQEINIASLLFELIHLEIPMKKVHPRFQSTNEEDELIFTSKKEDEKEKSADPRWEALKKLK